jgi:hypothetical protein
MRKVMLAVVAAMVMAVSSCGGTGSSDPDDMMGPGNMGDDDMMMRVAAADTSSFRL